MLSDRERLAVQTYLSRLYAELGSDQAIGSKIGASQQSVNKARLYAAVGPLVAMGLYAYLKMSREEFLAKHALPEKALVLDPKNPEHYAAVVRAIGKSMNLPPDEVESFLTAARRGGQVSLDRVPGALEAFRMTKAAAGRSSRDEDLDALESRTAPKRKKR